MEEADSSAAPTTLQRQFLSVVLDRLWPQLDWRAASDAVLHVGCGPGDVTALELLLPRLPVDARVITAGLSDSWERNQRRAIKNISKLLCSGGETALILISHTGLLAMYANVAKTAKWSSYFKDYQQFLSPHQLPDNPQDVLNTSLQEAGLAVKTCFEQEIIYVTEDESSARETMAAINPFLSRVPKDMRRAFQGECEEAALKNGGAIDRELTKGKTTYKLIYNAIVAHAQKT